MSAAEFFTQLRKKVREFKDRGSRFIGYSFNIAVVEDLKSGWDEVKKAQPKATPPLFCLPYWH